MNRHVFLLLLSLMSFTGYAQIASVKGEALVKEGPFVDAVINGKVYLLYDGELTYSTRTDYDGKFEFPDVTPGEYMLVVDHVRYGISEEIKVVAKVGRITTVEVNMSPPADDMEIEE
ncbi:carboxypeptidase-like regulatory domain-containing protein [Phaeocystidibacter marisrubri]|uniref:Carboxypeptidase regulatory-like domain-containing protein n=1 Tax=Phaeocystidibacter marisrubri TaxID=1577780 RepID=A0A6L3ZCN0_9FLAO|nr:carboxypeptidase-like regulatory domain-containing protein [Phaeocystidibacter marisrubri]KAB2815069.1 carboxypeptidase regulatory-like domain-containing protein [Phaeocystidibacter marisrubri]